MKRSHDRLKAFNELVALKFQIYNGLFLGLPFQGIADAGVQLPLFTQHCRDRLAAGEHPLRIVEGFFRDLAPGPSEGKALFGFLFKFVQLIERQVVLFDALEDAAFPEVHDMDGPGTLSHLLARVQESQRQEALAKALREGYRARIVLTAHPTQFYPTSILAIMNDLGEAIKHNRLEEINDLLLQMGKTRFANREKPTPLDEARGLTWYLENIFYSTLPLLFGRLLEAVPPEMADPFSIRPPVELGFWPGGDRDGNPFVTAQVTLSVAWSLRERILGLYFDDIRALKRRLTFDGALDRLSAIEEKLRSTLSPTGGPPPLSGPFPGEAPHPLPTETAGPSPLSGYGDVLELLVDLKDLRREITEHHQGLFVEHLDLFVAKVRTFGFHFAAMDLRQDSRIHGAALLDVFGKCAPGFDAATRQKLAGYAALSSEEKVFLLEHLLTRAEFQGFPQGAALDPLTMETLSSFAAARAVQKQSGERGLERYIISNSRSDLSVFEVMALASLAGWPLEDLALDIVPLFETIPDLQNAESSMRALFQNALYRGHLERRGMRQTVMLGFSDGTKDGGYFTANWSILRAKQNLTRIARQFGVAIVFFDGRGGPPSRGGGNTHKFYRAQGPTVEQREIQLTIQGQTISANFGTAQAARYNLEQLFTAGLEPKIFPEESKNLTPAEVSIMEEISRLSGQAYQEFKAHPLFLPYLEEMTPLEYYGFLNIASRPTRRPQADANGQPQPRRFEDLRAIPFVGAWSQVKQNIPGYYGFGHALKTLLDAGRRAEIEKLYQDSLFFRTLVENAMMSLSKSYFPLTAYLKEDARFASFWDLICKEGTLTATLLKEVTGQRRLLESDPSIRESIRIRERIILPLLVIQQWAMALVRESRKEGSAPYPPEAVEACTKLVVKTMAANINAARNSA